MEVLSRELSGGTGHRPVPSGDSPDEMEERLRGRSAKSSALPIPFGGSPNGAGESPAPPSAQLRAVLLCTTLALRISQGGGARESDGAIISSGLQLDCS